MGIPLGLSESPAPTASYSGNSVDSESPPTPHFDEKNSASATFLHQKTTPTVSIESENSEDQSHFEEKTDQDQSCLKNTIPKGQLISKYPKKKTRNFREDFCPSLYKEVK